MASARRVTVLTKRDTKAVKLQGFGRDRKLSNESRRWTPASIEG